MQMKWTGFLQNNSCENKNSSGYKVGSYSQWSGVTDTQMTDESYLADVNF